MEESSGAAMIRLTSSNYSIWKPRMEDILYCKDLYAPIVVQASSTPPLPALGQQSPSSSSTAYMFGSAAPSGANNTFQLRSQPSPVVYILMLLGASHWELMALQEDDEMLVPHTDFAADGPQPMEGVESTDKDTNTKKRQLGSQDQLWHKGSFPSSSSQPIFGNSNSVFPFGSSIDNHDQMNMEDSMAEDTVVQASSTPPLPALGQQSPSPSSTAYMFGSAAPSGANNTFQFGSQPSPVTPQNLSPFHSSSSLDCNAARSFSLGTGGGDKSNRIIITVRVELRADNI